MSSEPSVLVVDRLSARLAEMSRQLSVASDEVAVLRAAVERPIPSQPVVWPPPAPMLAAPPASVWPVPERPAPPARPAVPKRRVSVGVALAIAGVAVTLVGVVLLLVLAAQAGILRPEFRVSGGALVALGLVGAALWWHRKPAGRIGAIALAATGIAASYLDVLAMVHIYGWLPVIPGLGVAGLVSGGGLVLARLWGSEHLALLVIVPLTLLAPVLTGGIDVTLVGFMLMLTAATAWLQMGRDWIWLYLVRTVAPTLPLLGALVFHGALDGDPVRLLAPAIALNAILGVGTALVIIPRSRFGVAASLIAVLSVLPIMVSGAALGWQSAVLLNVVAGAVLLVLGASVVRPLVAREVFLVTSLVLALVAVGGAFDATVAMPVTLGLAAVVVAAAWSASRTSGELFPLWRWSATGLGTFGILAMLNRFGLDALAHAHRIDAADGVAALIGSLLAVAVAVGVAWLWRTTISWSVAGVVIAYAITVFAVDSATLTLGVSTGFLAGHVVATICWMVLAAMLMMYARRLDATERTPLLTAGLCLVAASVAKLFLFDLAALDGMFRVVVFILAGLILLAMGAVYARSLDAARTDGSMERSESPRPNA